MRRLLLAPYSAKRRDGQRCAKDYPWWDRVVAQLNALDIEVIQIGVAGEQRIEGVSQFIINWPLSKLCDYIKEMDGFLSVDSFLPHLIHSERLNVRGVVVWSVSDPEIWGHPENFNIIKSRKFLRDLQYQDWHNFQYNEAAFVLPHVVVEAVQQILTESVRPAGRLAAV